MGTMNYNNTDLKKLVEFVFDWHQKGMLEKDGEFVATPSQLVESWKIDRNRKVIYKTQFVALDEKKEYPHGWGFEPPLVEFPKHITTREAFDICQRELSNDEFKCIGAIPQKLIALKF